MKRILSVLLSSVFSVAFGLAQSEHQPLQNYDAVKFSMIVDTTIVGVTTAKGEKVTLQVLPATCLAIYFSNQETRSAKPGTFDRSIQDMVQMNELHGSLSIRTKPRSEIHSGVSMDEQMRVVPVRLDFADATVTVHKKK